VARNASLRTHRDANSAVGFVEEFKLVADEHLSTRARLLRARQRTFR
jgi:hypothetical protein